MKKIIYILLTASLLSCSNDNDLASDSVIIGGNASEQQQDLNPQNPLDIYIEKNITQPYNIRLIYRFLEREITRSWVLTPTKYQKAVEFSTMFNYLFMEPYVQATSKEFMKEHSFNTLILIGENAYHATRTPMRGLATNGVKIHLMNINNIRPNNIFYLNDNVLRTLYHETAHTWHQYIDYPTDYKRISGTDYKSNSWNGAWSGNTYLRAGFISAYGSYNSDEDFVEMIARYIIYFNATQDCNCATTDTSLDTNNDGFDDALYTAWKSSFTNYNGGNSVASYESSRVWEEQLALANFKIRDTEQYTGKEKIEQKMTIIRNYLTNNWNIDLDILRKEIRNRYPYVAGRTLDGTSVTQKDFSVLTDN
ncbi:MAG: putative zinc-binding metallopeptidase [Capnocytophaga sp.]|nr:putative zinc-binding metallopeptidase [Capnocytophaga sp.]